MLTWPQQLRNKEQQLHQKALHLQDRALRCRQLAETAMTEEGRLILCEIASRYEAEASSAETSSTREALETAL